MATMTRPGGRSARVQRGVHDAVRALQAEGTAALTVPQIAARAGVTPSTIYRRWGDLADLLADVALERLQPESEPADTGSFGTDLLAWTEQYVDEMASPQGRGVLRDVAVPQGPACACGQLNRTQLELLRQRALGRGEQVPELEHLINAIVAPVAYRILFTADELDAEFARDLVENALAGQARTGSST
ncbi:MAG TPA: TetR/AcrR family transcriptional regulator [Jatrophihabitans sp.]|nr:TetR/AcrR family transcriptional regulator [Jatrophihabitans sp.]